MTKEKKLNEISPVMGMFSTLEQMMNLSLGEKREWRNDAFNNKEDDWVVDTCVGFDTGTWETGISQDREETWTIVEQYADRREAEIGHAKWVELMKENPRRELESINIWGIL